MLRISRSQLIPASKQLGTISRKSCRTVFCQNLAKNVLSSARLLMWLLLARVMWSTGVRSFRRKHGVERISHVHRVIVTAASSNHLGSVIDLARTHQLYGSKVAPLIIYTLALAPAEIEVLTEFRGVSLRKLDFSKLPEYMDIDIMRGEYAWKPVIIKELSSRFDSILWLDAGCRIVPKSLQGVFLRIEKRGFVSTATSGTVNDWTHPMMIRYFEKRGIKVRGSTAMCNGAIIGIHASVFESVLENWYRCALDKQCIAPPGSSRANHRQDQSALTIVSRYFGYNCHRRGRLFKNPADEILIHQDTVSSIVRLHVESNYVCGGYIDVDTQIPTPLRGFNLCSSAKASLGQTPHYHFELYRQPDVNAGGRLDPIVLFEVMRRTETEPNISIVMPVYNAAPALQVSLPQLFASTTGSWELTIILDACFDASLDVAKKLISDHFETSTCIKARIFNQQTAIWEVSSDNLGMRTSQPKYAYVLVQADNIIDEVGWNDKMLAAMMKNDRIFGISGRCGHSLDGSNKVGRCGEDIAQPLTKEELQAGLRISETINRGPLMYRASIMVNLKFLDEVRFLLDGDDHDVNMRASAKGYQVGYLPVGSYAPLELSPRRNPAFRIYTPRHIAKKEEEYKRFRLKLSKSIEV